MLTYQQVLDRKAFGATIIQVGILVHHCIMGSYMITSNAAGSPGDRGCSLLTGLVLPTLAMLQGFYDLMKESKAAALQPYQIRAWYNILSRFKAYMLHVPEPHPTWWTHVWVLLGALVGDYPPAISRGEGWPLKESKGVLLVCEQSGSLCCTSSM
ncbi:TPA: hypothetical protein ACH3X3_008146 [Trebouxia sp. C0006]